MAKVAYEIGNAKVSTRVVGVKEWQGGNNTRQYFQLESTGQSTKSLSKLYLVQAGSTRDHTVQVDGFTFGYDACYEASNSYTKRYTLMLTAEDLAGQLIKENFGGFFQSQVKPVKKDKSSVMKRAWELARQGVKKFGGKVKDYFRPALSMAWAEV